MDIPKQVIRGGCFSGNNGPQFYIKPSENTYEKLPVDYDYRIPSPSIAEARKMMQLSEETHESVKN